MMEMNTNNRCTLERMVATQEDRVASQAFQVDSQEDQVATQGDQEASREDQVDFQAVQVVSQDYQAATQVTPEDQGDHLAEARQEVRHHLRRPPMYRRSKQRPLQSIQAESADACTDLLIFG